MRKRKGLKTMKPKKITAFLLSLVMILSMFPTNIVFADATLGGGDGTSEATAYAISTLEQLEAFAADVNAGNNYSGKYIKLTTDIDLSSKYNASGLSWEAIGNDTTQFAGTFDGNSKEIKGLYVNQTPAAEGNAYAGLFGYVADGIIKNLTVSGAITVSKTAEVGVDIYIGGVVARTEGSSDKTVRVENCENKCTITVPEISGTDHPRYIGGVIGYNDHNGVKDCKNSGAIFVSNVTGALIGGVVGYSYTGFGTMENCTNTAAITGSTVKQSEIAIDDKRTRYYGAIGGVIGYEEYIFYKLSNCLNKGDVTAKDGSCVEVGGVAGYHYLTIENCRNEGNVSNDTLYDSSMSTSSYYSTGGVVGYNYGDVKNCSNSGNVTGKYKVGGVVGRIKGDVIQCYNTGNVTFLKSAAKYSNNQIGGVVGTYNALLNIKNCYNTGTITFDDDENYKLRVGGIVADCYNSSAIISECYNMGKIQRSNTSAGENTMVGVIIGEKSSSVEVLNCYYLDSWNSSSAITATDTSYTTSKTADEFAGGEVAYLLQNAQDDSTNQVWGQKLGTDKHPVLSSNADEKVFKVTFSSTDGEYAVRYATNGKATYNFPAAPTTDENYKFKGWSTSDSASEPVFDKDTAVTSDMTVYAWKSETTKESSESDTVYLQKNKKIADDAAIDLNAYVENKSGAEKSFAFTADDDDYPLPEGLTLDEATGKITGTPTADAGVYTVKLKVANNSVVPLSLETTQGGVDVLTLTFDIDLEGEGAETDPYLINNLGELEYFRDKVKSGTDYNGKHVKLMKNIDMTGSYGANVKGTEKSWTPIGYGTKKFKGTFDGNGLSINNIYINESGFQASDHGLFGLIENAAVKNLTVGGTVTGRINVGGIVGWSKNSTLENLVNKVNVTATPANTTSKAVYAGGIAGYVTGGNVKKCRNEGTVTGNGTTIGGIAGEACGNATVENCVNVADITTTFNGEAQIGGVVGYEYSATVKNSYNIGKVKAPSSATTVGGVLGEIRTQTYDPTDKKLYYLDTAKDESTVFDSTLGVSKTAAEFESGEIAWLLQDGQTEQIWGQKLGTDKYPVLSSNTDDKVFKLTFKKYSAVDAYAERYATNGNATYKFPDDPTDENYKFKNWSNSRYFSVPEFDKDTVVTEDTTLYAWGDQVTAADTSKSDTLTLKKNEKIDDIDLSDYVKNKSGNSKSFAFTETEDYPLPEGLALDESTGKVSGTPKNAGVYTVKFNVANNGGISLMSLETTSEGTDVLTLTFDVTLKGEGAEANPYLIEELSDLEYLRDKVNMGENYKDKYFRLEKDLDMSGTYAEGKKSWTPIGRLKSDSTATEGYKTYAFSGIFDGNGKKIEGIYIKGDDNAVKFDKNYKALFGVVENATVKNLTVSGKVDAPKAGYASGIAAKAINSKFEGLTNNVTIIAKTSGGGIVGFASGTVSVIKCANNADITLSGSSAGGIVGYASKATEVKNCYNIGSITASVSNAGGIVGFVDTDGKRIATSYSIGKISSPDNAGGIVGYDGAPNPLNCYYLATSAAEGTTLNSLGTDASSEYFEQGGIAYTLQSAQESQDVQVWGQKIKTENYPILTSDPEKTVYSVSFEVNANIDNSYNNYGMIFGNKGEVLSLPGYSGRNKDMFKGWSEAKNGEVITSCTVNESDVKVYSVWNTVTFAVTDTNHIYKSEVSRNITVSPKINGVSDERIKASDFTVKYYEVYENKDEIKSATPVTKTVAPGKYLYVIDFAEGTDATKYGYIKNKYTVESTAFPDTAAYDNVGFMYITSGVETSQKPIHFEKQVVNVLRTGQVTNNLVNPNGGARVTYESSDESVATVANDGSVTITGAGSTVIIATSSTENAADVYASYTLNVTKEVITVTAKDASVSYGDEFTAGEYEVSKSGTDITGTPSYKTDYRRGDGAGRYDISVSGLSSELYEIEYKTGKLTVTPKALSLGTDGDFDITVNNKEYDGTKEADITATVKSTSLYSGDKVTVLISGSYDKATVDAEAVTYEITGLSGKDSANYTLSGTMIGTLDAEITPAKVKLSAPSYTSYVYDGEAKSVNVVAYANGIYFDKFTVKYATTTSEETAPGNVGTYTVKVTLTDNNYQLDPSVSFDATLEIKSAQQSFFSIEGVSDTVTYGDTVKLQAPGAIDGGDISYSVIAGTDYAEVDSDTGDVTLKGVGTVTVKATSTKANYAEKTATRTFVIKPKTLTVTAAAENKIYDGSTDVTVSLTLSGVADGDSGKVAIDNSALRAVMESADVETGKTVYITDIGLTGEKAANYQLSSSSMQTTVNVSKKKITEVEMTANDKEYDGTTAAAGYTVKKLSGVIDADKDFVKVTGTASFDDKTVSGASKVTLSELVLSGAKSGNYYLGVDKAEASAKINKATVNFEFGALSYVYDGTAKTVSVTAKAGGKTFEGFSVKYGGEASRKNVGEYAIEITLNDEANYVSDYAGDKKLKIVEAEQSEMTLTGLPGTIEFGRQFTLTAIGGSSEISTTWESSNESVATVSDKGLVTITGIGEVTITAKKRADGNFKEQSASITFTPTKRAVTIKVTNLNQVYDGQVKEVGVTTIAESATVKYFDEDNNPVAEPKNAGTYYVEVTANGNYEGEQSAVLTIKKAKLNTQGIAINVPSDLVYGTAYNVTVSGYEGTDYTLTYVGTGLYGDEENAPKNAGSYTAILTIENANYETATVKKPFTIAKKTLTAKADDKERAYGENNPELTVTLTGFCSGDDESAILMKPTASTKATSSSAVAAYDITVSGGYADNYDFTYEKGTLTVNAANNGNFYISGGNTNPYVGNSFTLTAYYNNERPTVTWSSSDSGIAAVDQTGKVTIIDVGSVTITAKMNDSRFDSSLEATFKLTASRLPETQNAIFFTDPIVEKYIDAEAFTLAPTNLSDGASVTEYKSSNPEIASVDNNGKVTLHKVGTVVITAKAEKFNCADVYASYTLTVKKVPVTVTAVDKSLTYGDEFVGEVKFSDDELKAADFGGTLSYNTRYSVGKGVGEYDVTPSGLTSDKYDITFVTGTITVNEKTLKGTDFDVKVKESKPYDGTTDIKLSATVKESAVVGNDKLYVEIEGAYDDASAGEDIGVTYDILSISGRGFENYVLEDTTGLTTKANIEKAEVSFFVSNETVKNYDGTAQKVEISAMVNGNVFGSENYTVWYKKGDEEKTKTPVNVGEYKVSVELADEDNYKVKEFDAVLTISMDEEAELTIKGSNKNVTVGDMFTLYAQYGNENAEVSWSSNDESVATVDEDGNVTVKKSGEVTLTATMTDPNYNGLSAELDLTASKKHINLSVSATELVKVYNGEAQYIKFTSDTVDLEKENVKVNTAYVMTTDSDKQEPKDVGTYTVSYEIEDERYEGSNVLQLTINKATVTVYAEAIEKEYGDEPVYKLIVSDNVKGISGDSMIEDGFVTITSDGEAKTAEVGEYDINVALKYLSDNNVDYVVKDSGKLTVTKATLTLSIADITREYGEKNPTELTYEIKGFKNGETEAVLTGSISPAYAATIEEKVGIYKDAVTVAGALENKNYNVVVKYTDGEGADLTITRVKVTVTAGTAKTSYLSAKFDKGLTGLTADNFTVKNGNETVILTGVTSSGGGKTYTLKGKFTEGVTYTVTISLDGSEYEETHEIVEGSTLEITPARATSTGGGGGGGSSSGGSATVSYTVTFETNGGSKISSVKVEKNSNVTAPAEPTKEGFEFGGWYTDKKLTKAYDFDTKVTKSLTLYAKWNEAEEPDEDKKDDSEKNENKENKEWKNPFADVKENAWYYDSVKYANENGLMSGVTNTEFAPEGTLTRGMLVTVLYRAEGSPAVNKSIAFGDVDASAYYLAAVNWAQKNGIVSGISETEFAPDENITREQIATIIYRYAKFKGIAPEGAWAIKLDYADLDEISDYAAEGIMYCTMKGIMKGKDNNSFAPKDNATRAEIAAILQRFANEVK